SRGVPCGATLGLVYRAPRPDTDHQSRPTGESRHRIEELTLTLECGAGHGRTVTRSQCDVGSMFSVTWYVSSKTWRPSLDLSARKNSNRPSHFSTSPLRSICHSKPSFAAQSWITTFAWMCSS